MASTDPETAMAAELFNEGTPLRGIRCVNGGGVKFVIKWALLQH